MRKRRARQLCYASVSRVLSQYKEVHVTAAQAVRFKNGGELFLDRIGNRRATAFFRVFSPENEFLGIGEKKRRNGMSRGKEGASR